MLAQAQLMVTPTPPDLHRPGQSLSPHAPYPPPWRHRSRLAIRSASPPAPSRICPLPASRQRQSPGAGALCGSRRRALGRAPHPTYRAAERYRVAATRTFLPTRVLTRNDNHSLRFLRSRFTGPMGNRRHSSALSSSLFLFPFPPIPPQPSSPSPPLPRLTRLPQPTLPLRTQLHHSSHRRPTLSTQPLRLRHLRPLLSPRRQPTTHRRPPVHQPTSTHSRLRNQLRPLRPPSRPHLPPASIPTPLSIPCPQTISHSSVTLFRPSRRAQERCQLPDRRHLEQCRQRQLPTEYRLYLRE